MKLTEIGKFDKFCVIDRYDRTKMEEPQWFKL